MNKHPENRNDLFDEGLTPVKESIVKWVQKVQAETGLPPITLTFTDPGRTRGDMRCAPLQDFTYNGYEALVGKKWGGNKIHVYLGADSEILAQTEADRLPVGPYRTFIRVRYSEPNQDDRITSYFIFHPHEIIQTDNNTVKKISKSKSPGEPNHFQEAAAIAEFIVTEVIRKGVLSEQVD